MSSAEERVNAMRGYKATLNNPRVSDEAKQNAQSMLDQLGGDQPSHDLYSESGEQNKDPMRVNAGLKAAAHNPNVSDEARRNAAERVGENPEE
ncbi:Conidiation protein 6-domain-containing protein [Aspergillus minisclerotigenes]|uniref:Conidiation protein 6-domain-containing protein n=1 Tax=Aspergillus minisclerotigenes TaxID=656917 RepID=A0A5N6IVW5_9EURO|nr:Conidiation protein 6-domain-containing protein [Aspergillus minisclerotigenes]